MRGSLYYSVSGISDPGISSEVHSTWSPRGFDLWVQDPGDMGMNMYSEVGLCEFNSIGNSFQTLLCLTLYYFFIFSWILIYILMSLAKKVSFRLAVLKARPILTHIRRWRGLRLDISETDWWTGRQKYLFNWQSDNAGVKDWVICWEVSETYLEGPCLQMTHGSSERGKAWN